MASEYITGKLRKRNFLGASRELARKITGKNIGEGWR
jgi:hypothetical protein